MDQVMHKLRIAHRDATTITVHADFDSAREALQTHAKVTDTYLHVLTPRACLTNVSGVSVET